MSDFDDKKYKDALKYAASFCSKSEKCIFDIEKKLKFRELSDKQVKDIIDYLINQNFINEERYAIYYTRDKFKFQKWGRIKIVSMLKGKRITEKNINLALKEISEKNYEKVLEELIIKKSKTIKFKDEYNRNIKIIRYAVSKGYEKELVLSVLKNNIF